MPMALTGINDGGPPPYSPEVLRETKEALRPLAQHMTAENVAPLVVYLASRRCAETHRIFSVGAGHVTGVFIAATNGWNTPDLGASTAEQVEANLDAACALADFAVPESFHDELRFIAERLPEVT